MSIDNLFWVSSVSRSQNSLSASPSSPTAPPQRQMLPAAPTQPSPQPSPQSNLQSNPQSNQSIQLSYQYETYVSRALGGSRSYGISLPPDYNQNPKQRYPVIFLLHGGHGNPSDWWQPNKGNAVPILQMLYQSGQLPPSIIITPDGNDLRGSNPYHDPQYFDGKNGQVSTAIGDELVNIVQQRYRTLSSPKFWAIGGLSSGGWGAVNIGLQHANHFSILFSHSGYFVDKSGSQNSPLSFVDGLPKAVQQQLRIYLDVGESDEEYPQSKAFHQHLNELKIFNQFRSFPGSHTWVYWHQHLADSLAFVGEQFKQAEAR